MLDVNIPGVIQMFITRDVLIADASRLEVICEGAPLEKSTKYRLVVEWKSSVKAIGLEQPKSSYVKATNGRIQYPFPFGPRL